MVKREFSWIPVGRFVSLPRAKQEVRQSETIWHISGNSKATALSIPLSGSDSIPPTPNGITIFTCARLACKREEVKRNFCGRKVVAGVNHEFYVLAAASE